MIDFVIYLLIITAIYAILSLSLNFQYGFTGLANFGHVGFFCLGAYTSTLLVLELKIPFLIGILGSFFVAAAYGALISLPTGNLKEDYWAITTLAGAEIIRLCFLNGTWYISEPYAGGPFGIRGIPRPWESVIPSGFYPLFYMLLSLFFLIFAYSFFTRLMNTPFGRVLKFLREDEDLPLALGKNVFMYKLTSMTLSGGFAGLAGALFAHYISFIAPSNFVPLQTFIIWAMVVVGGKGNNLGAIIGALAVQLLYNGSRILTSYVPIPAQTLASLRMVAIGLLIVLIMVYKPQGLIKERKKTY